MMVHDSRVTPTCLECLHLLYEMQSVQAGQYRSAADTVTVGSMASCTGG